MVSEGWSPVFFMGFSVERLEGLELRRSSFGERLERLSMVFAVGIFFAFSWMIGGVGAAFVGASPSNTIPLARNLSMTPSGYVIEIFCPHSIHCIVLPGVGSGWGILCLLLHLGQVIFSDMILDLGGRDKQ